MVTKEQLEGLRRELSYNYAMPVELEIQYVGADTWVYTMASRGRFGTGIFGTKLEYEDFDDLIKCLRYSFHKEFVEYYRKGKDESIDQS